MILFGLGPANWIPIAISVLAIIVACGSLYVANRAYHRDDRLRLPLTGATVRYEGSGWYIVDLQLTSRDSYGYRVNSIRILKPSHAKALRFEDAPPESRNGPNPRYDARPMDKLAREISSRLRVRSAGHETTYLIGNVVSAPGATHSEPFYLLAGRSREARPLTIRVEVVRMAEIEKPMMVTVKRTLPPSA